MVTETFFSVGVRDMERARAFYVGAFGADVTFASPGWSSLRLAGVRVALVLDPEHAGGHIGLHFAVRELDEARAAVERAAGRVVEPLLEPAPGVVIALVADTEANTLTLRQA